MSRGVNTGSSATTPLRHVVPTTKHATPGVTAPAPSTQAGRSPAPTATGVPAGKPVATAAASVSPPARSVDSAQDPPTEKDVRNAIERTRVSATRIEIVLNESVIAQGQDRVLTLR